LKKIAHKLHLILGIISGLVVFIVAITGCLWVFQEEISSLSSKKYVIENQGKAFISPTKAKEIACAEIPDKKIHGTIYGNQSDPVTVVFYQTEPEFYWSLYLNPYTGAVLGKKNHREGFFWWVLKGHLYLWLPKDVGSQITGYGTMIFVIMLFSGIVLWWPKKKKNLKQRMTFSWSNRSRWRRKNYDIHNIGGFYISIIALIIAFSGLVMAFDWVYYMTYKAWGGNKSPRFETPMNISGKVSLSQAKFIDTVVGDLKSEYPDYKEIEVHYPHSDSTGLFVEVSKTDGIYYNSDYLFFDQRTGDKLDPKSIYSTYTNASIADKVIRMNYDIHIGAIGGFFGKILACIISLVAASLPISGFMIYLGRKNKVKNKNPK
jgi:uncharacterized iron-regulated membrane protein